MNKKNMLRKIADLGTKRDVFRKPLTKRQAEILEFIKLHSGQYGFPPTRKEISDAFGFSSWNAAHQHLVLIARKGYLRMQHAARGIVLLEQPHD